MPPRRPHPVPTTAAASRRAPLGPARWYLDRLLWVLLLAGLFDGLSDNWVHGVVLWLAAVLVAHDARSRAQGRVPADRAPLLGPQPWPWPTVVALVVAWGAAALLVGSWLRYTWPVTVAVVVPGLVALVVAWHGPVRPRPPTVPLDRAGARLWGAVVVFAGLWELSALLQQPSLTEGSPDHPTVSVLMDSVLEHRPGRTLTYLAWLALGWWLLTRAAPARTAAAGSGQEATA